ncbi:MAG: hypothetical protein HYZ26_01425 [Chloroflexi bacterium]|nr:hypothetical protein [Chloroflexota bacterium]
MLPFRRVAAAHFLTALLAVNLVLGVLALLSFQAQMTALDYFSVSAKLRLLRVALIGLLAANAVLLPLTFTRLGVSLLAGLRAVLELLSRLKAANLIGFAALLVGFPWLVFSEYGLYLEYPMPRLWVFWLFALAGAALLKAWRRGLEPLHALLASAVLLALAQRVAVFLPEVSAYPLSLGWSEVSRYYQASLYFSERIYGLDLPLSVTHPSRYMLQALPFIVPDLPLWAHRAWQVFLWWSLTGLTAALLARRLRLSSRALGLMLAAWAFLFMMQGAVFYNLLPAVIIVLWGFDPRRYGRSLAVVALASLWAGVSRINWTPVPGLLAASLMYVEAPTGQRRGIPWRYFWRSFSYFALGMASALAAYAGYISLSGNADVEQFGSAFTSDLLWNRLWPSPSFPLGILPGILLVSLPLLVAAIWAIRRQGRAWHAIRRLGLGSILLVLFGGGLVVSVKIGGGTNLHNLDAFMVLLMTGAAAILLGRSAAEPDAQPARLALPAGLLAAIVAVPVALGALTGGQWPLRDHARAWETVAEIDALTQIAAANGDEVLLISQRQLLTFDMLATDVRLVPEYEQIFLMEMAISNNEAYLRQFYTDLAEQRFALIFSDPLFRRIKSEEVDSLAEENNAWVQRIIEPVLCAYYIEKTYGEVGVQVLKPRAQLRCDVFHAHPDP